MPDNEGTAIAPEGKLWVCLACGKTSRSRYGFDKDNKNCCDPGWDPSCVMNCELFDKNLLVFDEHGRVTRVKEIEHGAE